MAESWDEIDFDKLPNQFVLKCTHDSSGAFVCRDKQQFDFERETRGDGESPVQLFLSWTRVAIQEYTTKNNSRQIP